MSLNGSIDEKDAHIELLNQQLDNLKEEVQHEICKLQTSNGDKDSFIKRLQRRTQDFEDSALHSEQNFEELIKALEGDKKK